MRHRYMGDIAGTPFANTLERLVQKNVVSLFLAFLGSHDPEDCGDEIAGRGYCHVDGNRIMNHGQQKNGKETNEVCFWFTSMA